MWVVGSGSGSGGVIVGRRWQWWWSGQWVVVVVVLEEVLLRDGGGSGGGVSDGSGSESGIEWWCWGGRGVSDVSVVVPVVMVMGEVFIITLYILMQA